MKQAIFILSVLALTIIINYTANSAPNSMPIGAGVKFGFFYTTLSPHGEWIEIEHGFHVWRPFNVSYRWRPYLIGRWIWTDYGWYWMSREPFGWITYHYGRWYYDDYYGWVWVPDDVWGPAWVEWRYSDDYIGWAPLPPYAVFRIGIGIRFTSHWVAPVHYWNFVRYHRFCSVFRYRDVAPEEHTRRLIRTSRAGNQFEIEGDRIINRGVDRNIIERRGNVVISQAQVREVREQNVERIIRSETNQRENRIEIFRPTQDEMNRRAETPQVRRGERSLSIDMTKIERQRTEERNTTQEKTIREESRKERETEHRIKQEEPRRENIPNISNQEKPKGRSEKRRELLERYERGQNPTPPINREKQQIQNEPKRREPINPRIERNSPNRPTQRNENENTRRK